MTYKMIAAFSLPVLLFACGGSEGGAGLTQAPSERTPAATNASSPVNGSSGASGTQSVEARQLLQAQVASAALTLDDATSIALAANPDSSVLEADLDGNGETLRYEVELRLADGSVLEVHVDANTGEIIASFPEDQADDDDDDVAVDCTGAISAVEAAAVAIAEAEAGGTAVEVEIDDGCEFEVTVDTGAGFVEVEVAADGTVRQVENDDDGPGDDDDDDGPDDDDDGPDDDDDDDGSDDDDDGDD
jgi:uncharacterized membrane protein YkoI